MNDDSGHDAAEKILQQEQDDRLSDLVEKTATKNNITNWTHCTACYVRRDHIYDFEMKAWRCEFCGIVNDALTRFKEVETETPSLTSSPRRSVIDVAESYLEDHPEEG